MKMKTERAADISAYIKAHPDCKLRELPVIISGQRTLSSVYQLPVDLLRYNLDNGRFAVEKLMLEKEQGHALNYDDAEDVVRIRQILLEGYPEPSEKAMSLISDLERYGQLEPGIVTHDGFLINGNRRMAAIEFLHTKDPTGRWKFLEVQRLPEDISGADLWRIEAGLQLSKDKKEAYGPMNELLKIKEGIDAGLSESEVAAAMFEWTPSDVKEAVDRLHLIDAFLEYTGEANQGGYGFIERWHLHEFFIDLQNTVYKPWRGKIPNAELQKRINSVFGVIWAAAMLMKNAGNKKGDRITHWNIRELKKIFDDPEARELLEKHLGSVDNPKKLKPEAVRDDLKDAQDLLDLRKDSQQPLRLMEAAIRALKNIDRESSNYRNEDVRQAFKQLNLLVKSLAKDLRL